MIKVSAVALTAVILGAVLRKNAPEFHLLLVIGAGIWMLNLVAAGFGSAVSLMEELKGLAGLSEELLEPVVKTVVLSILTRVTAEICRSAGESGAAAFVETAGTVLAVVIALPLVRAVTVLIAEMLG
ncbi:MAG: SpoIIIAC/SpoIIIAD family protein [Lawsonibacter sp.]